MMHNGLAVAERERGILRKGMAKNGHLPSLGCFTAGPRAKTTLTGVNHFGCKRSFEKLQHTPKSMAVISYFG